MPAFRSIGSLALLIFLLGGAPWLRGESTTLAENKRLPIEDIREFVSPADWKSIGTQKISHLVIFQAEIRDDTSVRLGRVFHADPDGRWNEIARSFGSKARLNYSSTLGTLLSPRADVYVVFFEAEPSGDSLVLVYAKELGWVRRPSGGQRKFINQPLVGKFENTVSVTGPQFLQTFVINARR